MTTRVEVAVRRATAADVTDVTDVTDVIDVPDVTGVTNVYRGLAAMAGTFQPPHPAESTWDAHGDPSSRTIAWEVGGAER